MSERIVSNHSGNSLRHLGLIATSGSYRRHWLAWRWWKYPFYPSNPRTISAFASQVTD